VASGVTPGQGRVDGGRPESHVRWGSFEGSPGLGPLCSVSAGFRGVPHERPLRSSPRALPSLHPPTSCTLPLQSSLHIPLRGHLYETSFRRIPPPVFFAYLRPFREPLTRKWHPMILSEGHPRTILGGPCEPPLPSNQRASPGAPGPLHSPPSRAHHFFLFSREPGFF